MSVKELIVNAGSSSLKYTVYLMPEQEVLANGIFEQLTTPKPTFTHKLPDENGKLQKVIDKLSLESGADHAAAFKKLIETLTGKEYGVLSSMDEIAAVGHRVLHGGEKFSGSVVVDESVKEAIRECIPLGPLHNPANLVGIEACEALMPSVPQVAVFDTAFHQSIAPEAYMYALPYKYYKESAATASTVLLTVMFPRERRSSLWKSTRASMIPTRFVLSPATSATVRLLPLSRAESA